MLEICVPQNLVHDLRQAFLKEISKKPDDFVHPIDMERVQKDDLWLKRFLMHHGLNQKSALNMMITTVQWRREYGVHDIRESNIRLDYLTDGSFFSRGRDKEGYKLFIFLCKKYTKGCKNLDELKRCAVYWFERLEREEKGKGVTIVFDLEGCGFSNMDLAILRYLIKLFFQYYPHWLNYIILYELGWIFNAAYMLVKSWLPSKAVEKIKVVKKGEIGKWIPLNYAQTCWGGEEDCTDFEPENVEDIQGETSQYTDAILLASSGESTNETPAEPPTETTIEPLMETSLPETFIEAPMKPLIESSAEPLIETSMKPSIEDFAEPFTEASMEPFIETSMKPLKENSAEPLNEMCMESLMRASMKSLNEKSAESLLETSKKPSVEDFDEPLTEPSMESLIVTSINPLIDDSVTETPMKTLMESSAESSVETSKESIIESSADLHNNKEI